MNLSAWNFGPCRSANWRTALLLFSEAENADLVCYTAAVAACTSGSQWQGALRPHRASTGSEKSPKMQKSNKIKTKILNILKLRVITPKKQ